MRSRLLTTPVLGILAFAVTPAPNDAGDWPQILGLNRNGIAHKETLADSWPAEGPKVVWQRTVGDGFGGVAVAAGRTVLFHRVRNEELVEIMDANTGDVLAKASYPSSFSPAIVSDGGPRTVPLIHKGNIYVYGPQGGLRCADLKTGRKIWSRKTHVDFDAPEGYFGAGSSPLVEDGKLIVNVGGSRTKAGIVAFALDTGKTLWKATADTASYSSPVAVTVDGVRHLIVITRMNVVSLDPKTGRVRFQFPFGQRGPTINGANPLIVDGKLFVTASYGIGARYVRFSKNKFEVLWESDDVMSSQYTTGIAAGRHLYGMHGRQDQGLADLRCIDPKTRKVKWSQQGFGYATLIGADGKLIILKTDGELVLAKTNAERFQKLAGAVLFKGTCRALPALAGGYFYARDEGTLKCVDLGTGK